MNKTSIIALAALIIPASLSQGAEFKTTGTATPAKQSTATMLFMPKASPNAMLTSILPQGTLVKKGEPIATADTTGLDKGIKQTMLALDAKKIDLARAEFALDQFRKASLFSIEQAKRNLARAEEDLADFQSKVKPRLLEESAETVFKIKCTLKYKVEEIDQLKQMYAGDGIAADSEQVIMQRLATELQLCQSALANAEHRDSMFRTRTIVRQEEDLVKAVEGKKLELDSLQKQVFLDGSGKNTAMQEARLALLNTESALADLQADRLALSFIAPTDGLVIYGGYSGDSWVTASPAKLRPGGKLEPGDIIASVVDTHFTLSFLVPVGAGDLKKVTPRAKVDVNTFEARADFFSQADGRTIVTLRPLTRAAILLRPGEIFEVSFADEPPRATPPAPPAPPAPSPPAPVPPAPRGK